MLTYRVLNTFNDHKAGDTLPAEVVGAWPSEALANRILHKDIELVSEALLTPVLPLPPVLSSESAEGGGGGLNTDGQSEGQEDGKEADDDTSGVDKTEGVKPKVKPDTASMSKKDMATFILENFELDVPSSWSRADVLAKFDELTEQWPSS